MGSGVTSATTHMAKTALAATLLLTGCSADETAAPAPTTSLFDVSGALSTGRFFDHPYPSDARLTAGVTPALDGFLNPQANPLVDGLLSIAAERPGFPTVPVAYFRFSGALSPRDLNDVVLPSADAAALLLDVDESSPDYGQALPVVLATLPTDDYTPAGLLAVAARPGFVLHPERRYAFVVTDALRDATGTAVIAGDSFATLRDGGSPSGERGDSALYASLWPALEALGIAASRTVSATVFTTGDVVAELAALSDAMLETYDVSIDALAVDPDDGADHPRFCELLGTVSFPQFQRGTPPFDEDGTFEIGSDGLPVEQRQEIAPIVITLPNGEMPAGGYPLVMYFHGSGGLSSQVVDRDTVLVTDGPPTKGEGPAHVLAPHGFATAGSAHPVNPERLAGASEIAYLNLDNLKAFRDTFRQGVIEQRLYLDALLALSIDPQTVSSCTNLTLPSGETGYHFRADPVLALGQSMGGMYTNLIGAVEPRIKAVTPTGAGGFWSLFILETSLIGGKTLVPIVLSSTTELTFMHPALHMLETAWEPVEPMVYMPRLARRPLPGHPSRPVYDPVGKDDSYFPTQLYDAIALGYGHQQAGDEVWPSMQTALSLAELDGIIPYPVNDNLRSESGDSYTGVIVQYEGDGIYDPHAIFVQLDTVKHQYGCFFETFVTRGSATLPAPAPLGTPCD
jgi:hypothetical protein